MGSEDKEGNNAPEDYRPKADMAFEKLKREKLGTKVNEASDEAMLEWIELNKQLSIDRETGRPYHVTTADKTKAIFMENPLVPIGKYFCFYKLIYNP